MTLFVTEQDRRFAADILDDMSNFEEGITEQEKMAQWVRNIRNAALRSVTQIPGCQLHGPGACQKKGKCMSEACVHYNKTEFRPRMTVLAQVDGILYPPKETT